MPLLLDLENLSCAHTDSALEFLAKSLAEAEDDQIWRPHEDAWIREAVETFTQESLVTAQAIAHDLEHALQSLLKQPPAVLAKADDSAWMRWTPQQQAEQTRRIEHIPPALRTLDDWMVLVELIIHRYLPDGVLRDRGEYLAVLSHLAGSVRAHLGDIPDDHAARIARILPYKLRDISPDILTDRQAFGIRYAITSACNAVRDVVDKTRNKLRQITARWVRRMTVGDRQATPSKLSQELLDTFGPLNRDWRRIAITESGTATNTGFIASLEPGTRVQRMEAYHGACEFCTSIRGREFTVVTDDHEPKDWEKQVWPGKTNLGRSASPRKRVDGMLVPREPEELWSVPAGLVHPHCRGSWQVVVGKPSAVDAAFDRWARELLAQTAPKRA